VFVLSLCLWWKKDSATKQGGRIEKNNLSGQKKNFHHLLLEKERRKSQDEKKESKPEAREAGPNGTWYQAKGEKSPNVKTSRESHHKGGGSCSTGEGMKWWGKRDTGKKL